MRHGFAMSGAMKNIEVDAFVPQGSSIFTSQRRAAGQSSMLECVILIGLPAAGKTTFYRGRFSSTHVHVTKDISAAEQRATSQQKLIDATLASGLSVVVDNTNATVAERAKLIRLARSHGARIVGYFFDVTTRAAVARNANRLGRDKIPNVAIFTAAKRLIAPTRNEGFDDLFRVTIREDRSVEVSGRL
jgi:predicted kinase